ncbi:MAG: prepilin-type N-terminal cleavage/methylation domain-containing protein [Arcobacteraceae bacterium]|nr:prepilin-type N-terminal cleavage/methylation domain-containing protein [Arcobacteraceae bacterium]
MISTTLNVKNRIDIKQAFTLIEIIIVVIIIGIVYYFSLSNLNVNSLVKRDNVVLINIKQKLLKYDFNDNVTLKCIKDGKLCYIFVDGVQEEKSIENLFKQKPTVYTYDKNLDLIEFEDLEFERLESYEVCFEYSINKYQKSKDMVVEVDDKVYIFNSIDKKPTIIEYLSDVSIYFEDKENEVKDAF